MTARNRQRAKTQLSSRQAFPSGAISNFTNDLYRETCDDIVGDMGGEHPLEINRIERFCEPFTGDTKASPTDSTYVSNFNNYWPSYARSITIGHQATPGLLSDNQLALKVLGDTSPSRPIVDLVVAYAEIRELPRLMNLWAHKLTGPRTASSLWLGYHFGWRPLQRDLENLLNFQAHFWDRTNDLRKLYNGGGLKGKSSGGEENVHSRVNAVFDSSAGIVNGTVDRLTSTKKWATTRWRPDPNRSPPTTEEELMLMARRAVLGMDITPSTVWNAMPWTWLIDWFSNAGSYLETFRNTVPAIHSPVCVMQRTTTTYVGNRLPQSYSDYPNLKGGNFNLRRETKVRRVVGAVYPEVRFPFLDARQVSILGALAVTRIPKRYLF